MTRRKIPCGVLGLGRLGWLHARNLVEHVPGADLIAVADADLSRAQMFAREYAIPSVSAEPEAVLSHPDVEAVIIVTPTPTHAALIQQAAEAGKAIFVEKPLALSLADARLILRAVAIHHAYCQVGFQRRYDRAYLAAAEHIRTGAIGQPLYFKAVSRDPRCPPAEYIQHSGRLFADMSIHDYDIARFLLSDEVADVTAHGDVVKHPFLQAYQDVDQALTFVHFASGAIGDIEGSRNAGYGYDIRAEVLGTEGTVQINLLSHTGILLHSPRGTTRDIYPGFFERFADAYRDELIDFIARLRRGVPSPVTAEDGYRALAIAMAATRSFDQGRTVTLDEIMAEPEGAPAR